MKWHKKFSSAVITLSHGNIIPDKLALKSTNKIQINPPISYFISF